VPCPVPGVDGLDRHREGIGVQGPGQTVQVLRAGDRSDVGASWPLAGRLHAAVPVAGVDDRRHAGHRLVLADRDQFGPGAVADGGIGVQQPPVDLIADGVAGDRGADLFDDAGVVMTQDDGELMLGYALEDTGGDEGVHRADR
jgi:hypothetical protein